MTSNILTLLNKNSEDITIKKNTLITYINPHAYRIIRHNIELFEKFDTITIDGFSLLKLLNFTKIGNHTLQSLDIIAPLIFEKASSKGLSIYFIGAPESAIATSITSTQNKFPNLNIIGYRHGYFANNKERNAILNTITNLNPSIVMCGMGTSIQEKFLIDLNTTGWNGCGIACGGYLHQITSDFEYFPKWYRENNLKWLYRIIKEPKVNLKRNTIGFIQFLFLFFYDLIFFKSNQFK